MDKPQRTTPLSQGEVEQSPEYVAKMRAYEQEQAAKRRAERESPRGQRHRRWRKIGWEAGGLIGGFYIMLWVRPPLVGIVLGVVFMGLAWMYTGAEDS